MLTCTIIVLHVSIPISLPHCRGVAVSTIVTGLQKALDERAVHPQAPVDASLILCLVRELGEAAAAATLALTLPYLPSIEGLGLASTELGYPPEQYKKVYTAAGLLGLHKVAHAGAAYACDACIEFWAMPVLQTLEGRGSW